MKRKAEDKEVDHPKKKQKISREDETTERTEEKMGNEIAEAVEKNIVNLEEKKDEEGSQSTTKIGDVLVRVFDLSGGLMEAISLFIFGKPIEALYHCSIQVGDKEYYFNFDGLTICDYDPLNHAHMLLKNRINYECTSAKNWTEWTEHVEMLKEHVFTNDNYCLFENNCNHFVNMALEFLNEDWNLPEKILNQPSEIENTPLGSQLKEPIKKALIQIREKLKDENLNQNMDSRNLILEEILSKIENIAIVRILKPILTQLFYLMYREDRVIRNRIDPNVTPANKERKRQSRKEKKLAKKLWKKEMKKRNRAKKAEEKRKKEEKEAKEKAERIAVDAAATRNAQNENSSGEKDKVVVATLAGEN